MKQQSESLSESLKVVHVVEPWPDPDVLEQGESEDCKDEHDEEEEEGDVDEGGERHHQGEEQGADAASALDQAEDAADLGHADLEKE